MSVSSLPAALPSGWFLPCDRLCRHFSRGACASSFSLPFLPSPHLCNYPLATLSSHRNARRCNGHCLRVKSFHPQRNDTPPEVVARSGRLHDFWNFRSCDRELLRWRCARKENCCIRRARENDDRRRFARLRVKTPFRSVRIYSNEGFPRCFISRYLRDVGKLLFRFIAIIMSRLNTIVVFNYDKTSIH